jgi:putative ABC transport system ATP-binding protein
MSALFVLDEVSKSYRKGKEKIGIFDRLSLEIGAGEFIAIMGPSGSGKTTLLNLLSGIDRIDSGRLLFENREIQNLSEAQLANFRARNIGFIFQFYHLSPMLTARQNVELPLMLTSLSARERRERVSTALEIVNMSDRMKHKPREMSGGQQQRVAIARAIVADPAVLICDEPTGDLDRETANDIMSMLQSLNRDLGKTVILVTHDAVSADYASSMLHLDKGVFVEQDLHPQKVALHA